MVVQGFGSVGADPRPAFFVRPETQDKIRNAQQDATPGLLIVYSQSIAVSIAGRPMAEVDARDVLEKYIAAMNAPRRTVIRDISELPYPKEIIEVVVRRCIQMLKPGDKERQSLEVAYMTLAAFQPMTDMERKAVATMAEIGEPGEAGSQALLDQAKTISSVYPEYSAVLERYSSDSARLLQELRAG